MGIISADMRAVRFHPLPPPLPKRVQHRIAATFRLPTLCFYCNLFGTAATVACRKVPPPLVLLSFPSRDLALRQSRILCVY